MRTYGRIEDPSGVKVWVQVDPDPKGFLDAIYLTALCQVFKLNLGESPFFADWGLPALQSVMQQIAPDYYVALTQQRFAPYFLYLGVSRLPTFQPTYNVSVMFQNGAQAQIELIPTVLQDGFGRPILDGYGNPILSGTTSSGNRVPQ
jgi:hypothetical protein